MNENKKSVNKNSGKRRPAFLRILILVLLLCLAIFSAVIISDMVSKNSKEDEDVTLEPPFITIQICGDEIYLDGKEVTFEELEAFLEAEKNNSDFPEISIITDTGNPPHYVTYNRVAELLGNYGIDDIVRMNPASDDEFSADSTGDEV